MLNAASPIKGAKNTLLVPGQMPMAEDRKNGMELQTKMKKKDDKTPLLAKDNKVAPEASCMEIIVDVSVQQDT